MNGLEMRGKDAGNKWRGSFWCIDEKDAMRLRVLLGLIDAVEHVEVCWEIGTHADCCVRQSI